MSLSRSLLRAAVGALILGALITPTSPALAAREGTVGNCVSDDLYGNEPNIEGPFAPGGPQEQEPGSQAGRVVPSQSPGPFVNAGPNEPPRNDRTRGSSVGDIQGEFGGGAVPEGCRNLTGTP
jgi:hypothetical protein